MLNILPKVIRLASGGASIQTQIWEIWNSVSFTVTDFKYIWVTNIIIEYVANKNNISPFKNWEGTHIILSRIKGSLREVTIEWSQLQSPNAT